jgi:hypothetical protein
MVKSFFDYSVPVVQNSIDTRDYARDGHAQNAFRLVKLGAKISVTRLAGQFFENYLVRLRRPGPPMISVRRSKDDHTRRAGRCRNMSDAAVVANKESRT